MNITIRKGVIDDIDVLKDINLSSFEANALYDPHIDLNWVHTLYATEYFTDALTREDRATFVAQVDGTTVGYIVVEPKPLNYRTVNIAEVGNMAVLPGWRSKGIGTMLFGEAKRWAKEHGYNTLFVNAYSGNESAVAFYTAQGLKPIDISLEMDL